MPWYEVLIVAVLAFIASIAMYQGTKPRRLNLSWQCPWCGKVFGTLPDYIDHKDQHLKDEIENIRDRR